MKFKVMLSRHKPDLDKLIYPCYVNPLPNGFRFLYIPELGIYNVDQKFEKIVVEKESLFNNLFSIRNYIIEGYCAPSIEGNSNNLRLYLFDCLLLQDFLENECSQYYEERLKILRYILNDIIANYSEVIDLPVDIVYSPYEIIELYKYYLTLQLKGVIIRMINGKYIFGVCKKEVFELSKIKGNK